MVPLHAAGGGTSPQAGGTRTAGSARFPEAPAVWLLSRWGGAGLRQSAVSMKGTWISPASDNQKTDETSHCDLVLAGQKENTVHVGIKCKVFKIKFACFFLLFKSGCEMS